MARLGNVQLKNAKKLIHEGGDLGLRSLYEKAKMPERLFSAVRAAVQILAEEDYDGGRNDRERFVSRIIERLLTQFEDPASKMTQDDIDYLMAKLRQLSSEEQTSELQSLMRISYAVFCLKKKTTTPLT